MKTESMDWIGSGSFVDKSQLERVISQHSKSFSMASLFLPKRIRADARVVYAWCRFCDDLIDYSTEATFKAHLEVLEQKLARIYQHRTMNEEACALEGEMARIVQEYHIPRYYFDELIQGMVTDTTTPQFQHEDELILYCFRVAGVVGLIMSHLMGVDREEALHGAVSLGIAMQLTNISRDIKEDWARDRRYIPADMPAKGQLSSPPGPWPPKDKSLYLAATEKILRQAEHHYLRSEPHIESLPRDCRLAVRLALYVYRHIGRKILRKQVNPIETRSYTSKLCKIRLLLVCLWKHWRSRARNVEYKTPGRVYLFSELKGRPA